MKNVFFFNAADWNTRWQQSGWRETIGIVSYIFDNSPGQVGPSVVNILVYITLPGWIYCSLFFILKIWCFAKNMLQKQQTQRQWLRVRDNGFVDLLSGINTGNIILLNRSFLCSRLLFSKKCKREINLVKIFYGMLGHKYLKQCHFM